MAGNYPDVPAPKMAYDRDGTVGVAVHEGTGAVTQASTATLAAANDEDNDSWLIGSSGAASSIQSAVLIFPELRDILGVFNGAAHSNTTLVNIQSSVDTTNGYDGTWIVEDVDPVDRSIQSPGFMRTQIDVQNITAVKAIKWRYSLFGSGAGNLCRVAPHVYGKIAFPTVDSPDRMRLWHPTLDQGLDDMTANGAGEPHDGAWLDFGNVPRSSSADRQFRIKNQSATLTANDVIVNAQALTDTTPSVPNQMQFTKASSGTFGSSVSIPALTPGEISEVLTIRRVTPANATLSLWTFRVVASANSWT